MKISETGTEAGDETETVPLTSAARAAVAAQLTGLTNRPFYLVVLIVALVGSSTAARSWLIKATDPAWWHLPAAFVAVAVYELGAVAVSRFADQRRQLGERALVARVASAALAGGAIAAQYLGHADRGPAAFFAGISATGYVIYLLDSAAARRDSLRSDGKLADTPPAYGPLQWICHPWITRRARGLALVNAELRLTDKRLPSLGRATSLAAATDQVRAERRLSAIEDALRARIASGVDPTMAKIAVNTYNLGRVADGIAAAADYPALTRIITAELVPARLVKLADGQGATPAAPGTAPATLETAPPAVPATVPPPAELTVAATRPAAAAPVVDAPVPPPAPTSETGPEPTDVPVPPAQTEPRRVHLDPLPRPLVDILSAGVAPAAAADETAPVPATAPTPPAARATAETKASPDAADQGGTDETDDGTDVQDTNNVLAGVEDKLLPLLARVIDAHEGWATTVLLPPRHPDALNVPKIMAAAGTGSKAYGVALGRHLRSFAADPETVEAGLRSRETATAAAR